MSLHIEKFGSGEPLVLIHGWGMHGGIWDNVIPLLSPKFCVHCVDLPGHGHSTEEKRQDTLFTLNTVVKELSAHFDEPLNICGWSLGGQVALRWATLIPHQIKRLVLVASTPCFTIREDWEFGMAAETLHQFAIELERDHVATLRRFLALQVRGSENERDLLANLRSHLFSRGEPEISALRGGLQILRDLDLRDELDSICRPVLIIAGKRDKLTPLEASFYMSQALPDARIVEIAGAAHAPFLSHPGIFVEQISDFLHG